MEKGEPNRYALMIGDREWVLGKDFNRCYRRPGFHQTVSRHSGLEDEIWSDRDRGVSILIRVATAESAWGRGSSRLLSWDWTIYNIMDPPHFRFYPSSPTTTSFASPCRALLPPIKIS